MNIRHLQVAAFVTMITATGCAPEWGTLEFDLVSTPPTSHVLIDRFGEHVSIPESIAVVVNAHPISDNGVDYDEEERVELVSSNPAIFLVYRRPQRNEFVFVGVSAGTTCVEVRIDGEAEDCIPVQVTAPV